jgi:hypothetical protein
MSDKEPMRSFKIQYSQETGVGGGSIFPAPTAVVTLELKRWLGKKLFCSRNEDSEHQYIV